jgi:hypothetical protein
MDNAQFYDGTLTASEVQSKYEEQKGGNTEVSNSFVGPDPISRYTFNGDFSDSVGSADATKQGSGPTITNDATRGQVADLTSSGYLETRNLDTSSSHTYAAWVKFSSLSNNAHVIGSVENSGDKAGTWIEGRTSNTIQWSSRSDSNQYPDAGTISTGTWYHVVMVYDEGDGTKTYYINGNKVGSGPAGPGNSPYKVTIGREPHGQWGNTLYGYVDNAEVYDQPLTATEVQDKYNNQKK